MSCPLEQQNTKRLICILSFTFIAVAYILSRVRLLKTGFGLVIGFINNLQVVTTINCYTIAALHSLQSLHFSLPALVCTGL
jgi:hypothetical protein